MLSLKEACMKEKIYEEATMEIVLFSECCVRTSYGDDGNYGDWEDENTMPSNSSSDNGF